MDEKTLSKRNKSTFHQDFVCAFQINVKAIFKIPHVFFSNN